MYEYVHIWDGDLIRNPQVAKTNNKKADLAPFEAISSPQDDMP
jgi:hypothetical protein